jgi:magnesium transporter
MVSEESMRSGKLAWRNITNPTVDTLEDLQKEYGFHELDLEDCLSKTESPKIEEYDDYVFVVFHFPMRDVRTQNITIASLNVFIGQHFIITLSNGKLKRLDDFFERLREKDDERRIDFRRGSGYLLYLMMDDLFDVYNTYISQLTRSIREIEEDIFEGKIMKDRLYDIMTVKRQIINLRRALLPHTPIILALEHLHKRFINKKLELYFDNVADKINRAKIGLESMTETIETLNDANESLTSHNTNRVMKILTIFSVTLLPLTLLTGVYGMNLQLPYAQNPNAFWIVLGSMISTVILLLVFFRMKKYL